MKLRRSVLGVPVALVLVAIAWLFLLRVYPPRSKEFSLDLSAASEPELPGKRERIIVSVVSITTVALWMTTPLHGIHVAAISLIPIVGLTMTQVLGAADVRGLPWDTLMLVAGGPGHRRRARAGPGHGNRTHLAALRTALPAR